jgi:hypothetical protein
MRGNEKMKETLRHIEAFEYFYSLGGKTSDVSKVSVKCQLTERTIWRWYKNLNWREKIEQRNIENSKELAKKTDKTVLDTKANYRAEIKAQFSILKKMLNELIEKFKNNKGIEIKDITGLKDVIGCYERLINMDLTLMGEVSEREEIALRDADEKLFNKINSIIAREKKTKGLKGNKKFKQ